MSETGIARPAGRTQHSHVAEERYDSYHGDTGTLQVADFVHLTRRRSRTASRHVDTEDLQPLN